MQHRNQFSTTLKIALVAGKRRNNKQVTIVSNNNNVKAENAFNSQPIMVSADGRLNVKKEEEVYC